MACSIASLLTNLFGRGKEPFWQQAYTNLVKFIILLHKVAYDYVTLFDVYECAIAPAAMERKIKEAERRLGEADFFLVSQHVYLQHPATSNLLRSGSTPSSVTTSQEFARASGRPQRQGHFVRDPEPLAPHSGFPGQEGTARRR